ncbi:cytochrome c biogenesis protein CcsA [Arachidicoccus terrestris]|uniref:cytochrome c biogenesis protein CcsA n=1 Tax=Arachidicoccus terrestris TaxID=2875539 RepID=UPI001CC3C21F|nr:cytochrome c biogenesis protein CcsA [Arachidicoccus terrestris]UAY54038.1 cytochrome c biogenesis protein CcsA [Arachidicoccus terrestris]
MTYTGEHLLPGQLGHLASIVSLVVSLIATFAFFKSNRAVIPEEKKSWLRLARIAFFIETAAVVITIGCLYYILSNNLFEYYYAWSHSDKTLQPEYIFACLWEGQEGSFLLWTFWHCLLGIIVISKGGKWEAPVMSVVSFAQFCLATMIIGIYVFGLKIGSDPFLLMRQKGILDNAPVFIDQATGLFKQDYLKFLKDGQGLNSTLQNYWMVIHPPILFLGFASTIIPFAFCFSGLLNKDHSWTKPAVSWAAFSGGILSLGIMMGGAWAYESLNFGGYWAWDPVENASMVPWLIMVAGLHTNLVFNHSRYSLKTTYIFYILSFSFILYSTFLTRSGILGDTSVHAFTGADMSLQLILFILVFFIPALWLFFKNKKDMPTVKKEEELYSREFWMFIGSLVLFLSGLIIIGQTSMPVFNKIFGTKIAQPEDVLFSYNKLQIFIAFVIGILTAIIQFFKYKKTNGKELGKRLLIPTIIALALTVIFCLILQIDYYDHGAGFLVAIYLATFAAVYSMVGNFSYIFAVLSGKIKTAGASVAHIGFGLLLFGVLISSSKKLILSHNTTGIALFEKTDDEDPAENITLFKGIPIDMGKYMVTFMGDSMNTRDKQRVFTIHFKGKTNGEEFTLHPYWLKNNRQAEGFGATPDSKHYWNKDIYTYVSSWQQEGMDTATFRPAELRVGDTTFYSNGMIILNKVDITQSATKALGQDSSMVMGLDMTVVARDGSKFPAKPSVVIRNDKADVITDTVLAQGLVLKFNKVLNDKDGKLEIGVKESNTLNDSLTLKVIEFPFIGALWLGVIVMVIGFFMSVYQGSRKLKKSGTER